MSVLKSMLKVIGTLVLLAALTVAVFVSFDGDDARPHCNIGLSIGGSTQPVAYAVPNCAVMQPIQDNADIYTDSTIPSLQVEKMEAERGLIGVVSEAGNVSIPISDNGMPMPG